MKYILIFVVIFTNTFRLLSQAESDSISAPIEVSIKDFVHFANNSELISEIQSLEFQIKIYRARKSLVGIDKDFSSKENDLYIAVTSVNKHEKLYVVRDFYNIRDLRWLKIGEVPEFRFNYAGPSHTRTARFKIYSDRIERLY